MPGGDDGDDDELPEVVEVPIGDELDLHTFDPRDARELVADYVTECAARGFPEVRIVHGKGTGTLRRIVHSVLDAHADVAGYTLADGARGSWGATVVRLRARPPSP